MSSSHILWYDRESYGSETIAHTCGWYRSRGHWQYPASGVCGKCAGRERACRGEPVQRVIGHRHLYRLGGRSAVRLVLYTTPGDTDSATPYVPITGSVGQIAILGLLPFHTYVITVEARGGGH